MNKSRDTYISNVDSHFLNTKCIKQIIILLLESHYCYHNDANEYKQVEDSIRCEFTKTSLIRHLRERKYHFILSLLGTAE